jgi:plastocyanin
VRHTAFVAIVGGALVGTAVFAAPRLGRGGDSARAATPARPVVTIRLGEFFFRPARVTVHIGQRVRFLNVGKIAHTVADTDRHWDVRSKLIKPHPLSHGQTQFVRFSRAGVVYYLCTFHPTLMRGRITVLR